MPLTNQQEIREIAVGHATRTAEPDEHYIYTLKAAAAYAAFTEFGTLPKDDEEEAAGSGTAND